MLGALVTILAALSVAASTAAADRVEAQFWATSTSCSGSPTISTVRSTGCNSITYGSQSFYFNIQCPSGVPQAQICSDTSCGNCQTFDVLNNQCGHGFNVVASAKIDCIDDDSNAAASVDADGARTAVAAMAVMCAAMM